MCCTGILCIHVAHNYNHKHVQLCVSSKIFLKTLKNSDFLICRDIKPFFITLHWVPSVTYDLAISVKYMCDTYMYNKIHCDFCTLFLLFILFDLIFHILIQGPFGLLKVFLHKEKNLGLEMWLSSRALA